MSQLSEDEGLFDQGRHHEALRGVDGSGRYVTASSGSENYSTGTNLSLAVSFKACLSGAVVTVAGVIRGVEHARRARVAARDASSHVEGGAP